MKKGFILNSDYTPYKKKDIVPLFTREEVSFLIGKDRFEYYHNDTKYKFFCISVLEDEYDEEFFIGLYEDEYILIEE